MNIAGGILADSSSRWTARAEAVRRQCREASAQRIIVLLGAPGTGKGTQSRLLSELLNFPQISTGDILRSMAQANTPLGREIRETQAAGRLVGDEVLAEVIKTRTAQEDCAQGYILDGYPRTPQQAERLEAIAQEQGKEIQVLKLIVPRASLMKRLTGRRTCTKCGEIYNLYLKPPQSEGVCDLDGAALAHRSDDREETVSTRVTTYENATKPLTDYYLQTGRLIKIDAERAVDDVFQELCAAATFKHW